MVGLHSWRLMESVGAPASGGPNNHLQHLQGGHGAEQVVLRGFAVLVLGGFQDQTG